MSERSHGETDYGHPKVGDNIGNRTVIRVLAESIVFGQKEGDLRNCGAYVTSYREWFGYERSVRDPSEKTGSGS